MRAEEREVVVTEVISLALIQFFIHPADVQRYGLVRDEQPEHKPCRLAAVPTDRRFTRDYVLTHG